MGICARTAKKKLLPQEASLSQVWWEQRFWTMWDPCMYRHVRVCRYIYIYTHTHPHTRTYLLSYLCTCICELLSTFLVSSKDLDPERRRWYGHDVENTAILDIAIPLLMAQILHDPIWALYTKNMGILVVQHMYVFKVMQDFYHQPYPSH